MQCTLVSQLGGSSSSSSDSASDASTSSDSDSDDSSEEEFALRTQRNRDGTASSASAQERALLSALTAADSSSKVVAGRFGGREGKMARIRAQEAAAAAAAEARLGLGPGAAPEAEASATAAPAKAASSKPASIIEGGGAAEPRIPAGWAPTVLQGWWGSSMFAPAGVLEGMRKAESGVKDKGFTEDDQEQVYTRAQESQRKGHGGLGQSRRTIKVDGQAWAGTRTRFEDEAPSEAEAETGGQAADAAPETSSSSSAAAWAEEIKWKKVTSKFLRDAPDQKASLKKLRRHVAEHVRGKLGARPEAPGDDDIFAVLHEKLVASRQFVLQGKSVRLA